MNKGKPGHTTEWEQLLKSTETTERWISSQELGSEETGTYQEILYKTRTLANAPEKRNKLEKKDDLN